jgi:chorismate mutase
MSSALIERAPRASLPEPGDGGEVMLLRRRIDAVNVQLLHVLEHRAALSLEVARLKRRQGLPVYDAQRERDMLRDLVAESRGLLNPRELEAVFKRIFEASRAVAQRMLMGARPP